MGTEADKPTKPQEFVRRIVAETITIGGVTVQFWKHKRKWWFGCKKGQVDLTPPAERS